MFIFNIFPDAADAADVRGSTLRITAMESQILKSNRSRMTRRDVLYFHYGLLKFSAEGAIHLGRTWDNLSCASSTLS